MGQKVCSNPDCQKVYNISDKGSDIDCCSFECWEKINCKTPVEIQFENLEIV